MYKSRLKVWQRQEEHISRGSTESCQGCEQLRTTSPASATFDENCNHEKYKKYLRRNGLHHFIQDEKTSDPAWTAMTVSRTPPDMHDVRMSLHFLWTMSGWASWCKESGTWVDTGLRLSSPRTTASSLWAFDTFYAGIREAIDLIEDDQTLAAGTVLQRALEFCDGLVMATHWTFFLRLLDLYDVLLHRGHRALRKFLAREILAKAWLALPLRDPRLIIYRDLYQMSDPTLRHLYEQAASEKCLIDTLRRLMPHDHPEIKYLQRWLDPVISSKDPGTSKMQQVLKLYEPAKQREDLTCLDGFGFRNEMAALQACEWSLLVPEHYEKALCIAQWILAEMPKFEYHPEDEQSYYGQAWRVIGICAHRLGRREAEVEAICESTSSLTYHTPRHPFVLLRALRTAVERLQRLEAFEAAAKKRHWHTFHLSNMATMERPEQWAEPRVLEALEARMIRRRSSSSSDVSWQSPQCHECKEAKAIAYLRYTSTEPMSPSFQSWSLCS